ncbi:MAG TPA: hypothetical protein VL547_02070, partial [Dinghuibacter sp.]|uniref:hypothetical protein n=1 Tax=Dinghuibacter sp. TaxID=2024697 RepID=UPI002C15E7BD
GINSSSFSTGVITGGANNAYLYSTGNDFVIGNGANGKNLIFFAGGTATTNEAMRINSSGQVGIANTNPTAKLDVGGNFKLGSSGTVLNNVIKGSYTVTGGAINVGVGGTTLVSVAITGAPLHASVTVSPESALQGGTIIAYAYVSSAGTVTIAFSSVALLGNTIANGTVFDITVIQ